MMHFWYPTTWRLFAIVLPLLPSSFAQYPPPITPDTNLTIIKSPIDDTITISYKSPPPGTCTTIFSSQKQYAGYVTLPPFTLAPIQQDYAINTFFWFVEARQQPNTAPLTIWLNGGPGSSSMVGMFQENGPCEVVEIAKDKFGTKARAWGWDRSSNLLYIDEPNQVGFSFDTLKNGSLNLETGNLTFPPAPAPSSQPSYTFLNGTFSSNDPSATQNTTAITARATWHMLQGFLAAFPQYNPGTRPGSNVTSTVGINLFTESYGGKYGPAFAAFWDEQNLRRKNGSIPRSSTLDIELKSLGIMSGCVDDLIQAPFYSAMANNNTYGIQALDPGVASTATESFSSPSGCEQAINACRSAAAAEDPQNNGDKPSVNDLCRTAQTNCNQNILGPYLASGRNIYDITHFQPDPFPPQTYLQYLNTPDVLSAIGARTNYTETSAAVASAFVSTGDYQRGPQLPALTSLLQRGVRISLIHGDRDYVCNWLGGQALSFALAASLFPPAAPNYAPFHTRAGFADIIVNDSYVGGAVRQYANLSFVRVYDAGHLIPAYQPETAFTIFTRVITGKNIATGEPADLASFATNGTANSTHAADSDSGTSSPAPTCYLRAIGSTCSDRQRWLLDNRLGAPVNGILYNKESDWKAPAPSVTSKAGVVGTLPTGNRAAGGGSASGGSGTTSASASEATGVYVATAPPKSTNTKKAAAIVVRPRDTLCAGGVAVAVVVVGVLLGG